MKERKLRTRPVLLSGSYSHEFTQHVGDHLGLPVADVALTRFANTELKAEVPAVRGADVFVFQSHGAPVNEHLVEQAAIINAARRASARYVTAVVPYRGYGRADRPDNSHESYMGPLSLRFLAMVGADRILEVDPHAGQSAGFLADFTTEYTAIPAHPAIQDYLRQLIDDGDPDDVVIVSPDSGRAKLNRRYAARFDKPRAIIDKMRTGANRAEVMAIIGQVAGMRCFVIDDMIDTAGTIVEGAEALMRQGAKEVTVVATHGVLSDPATERLLHAKSSGVIARVAVTDTLKLPGHMPPEEIDVISVAPLVGEAIRNIYHNESVSAIFS
jgi:ribose-phosphate pyrophosphokinase